MNVTISELNTFLKGEHMAIDSYERYIQNTKDPLIKKELENIQKDHKLHAIEIGERILDLGGTPAKGVGVGGKVAEFMTNVKDINLKDTMELLTKARNGEDKGIEMASEIVKGDLDAKSMDMINNIISKDREHVNQLNDLIKTIH